MSCRFTSRFSGSQILTLNMATVSMFQHICQFSQYLCFCGPLFSPGYQQQQTAEGQPPCSSQPRRHLSAGSSLSSLPGSRPASFSSSHPPPLYLNCPSGEAGIPGSMRAAGTAPDAPRRFHSSAGHKCRNPAVSGLWRQKQGQRWEGRDVPSRCTPSPAATQPRASTTGKARSATGRRLQEARSSTATGSARMMSGLGL